MAVVSTFGIMTGDNWTSTMLIGMTATVASDSRLAMQYTGAYMVVYFIAVWFIGQFIYQTAFTGILLSQFDDLNVKSVKLVKDEEYVPYWNDSLHLSVRGNIHLIKVRTSRTSGSDTSYTEASQSSRSVAEGTDGTKQESSDFFVAESSEESLETMSSGQIKKKGSIVCLTATD
jgi:hypothetical protein